VGAIVDFPMPWTELLSCQQTSHWALRLSPSLTSRMNLTSIASDLDSTEFPLDHTRYRLDELTAFSFLPFFLFIVHFVFR